MKLIVGLGNPGAKYVDTRHNAGYLLAEALATIFNFQFSIFNKANALVAKGEDLIIAKPMTFMNKSGDAVSRLVNFYKVQMDDLYVVHDDLDILLGEHKIQKGVGPKEHNGVKSIEDKLGRADFWRVRVGVDNRDGDRSVSGEDYVLQSFSEDEQGLVDSVVVDISDELLRKFK
jgi:PTH1 family peptidyl-tRNA hydrolase